MSLSDHHSPHTSIPLAEQILDTIDVACYALNHDCVFIYLNRKAEQLFGFGREEILGKNLWAIFPEIVGTPGAAAVRSAISGEQPPAFEYLSSLLHIWISLTVTPVQQGGAIIMFNEINEIKQSRTQLLEERRQLNIAQAVSHTGYFERYLHSQQMYWSDEMYRLHGLEPQSKPIMLEEFIGYIHPDDQQEFHDILMPSLEHNRPFNVTNRILRADGSIITVNRRGAFLTDENGQCNRIYGTLQDITEQVMLEKRNRQLWEERHELESRRQQEIFKATVHAQEEERRRMAESLHNSLGQMLVATKLSLDQLWLDNSLYPLLSSSKAYKQTEHFLNDAIRENRRISHELMPTILKDLGLQDAIHYSCGQIGKLLNLKCEFAGPLHEVEEHLQIATYRMVQEMVLNIMKHAQASQASVRVEVAQEYISVEVQDDGKGIPATPSPGKHTGIGLSSIRETVGLLKGTLDISSAANQGTTIRVSLPVAL